jgi:hypothetical protein
MAKTVSMASSAMPEIVSRSSRSPSPSPTIKPILVRCMSQRDRTGAGILFRLLTSRAVRRCPLASATNSSRSISQPGSANNSGGSILDRIRRNSNIASAVAVTRSLFPTLYSRFPALLLPDRTHGNQISLKPFHIVLKTAPVQPLMWRQERNFPPYQRTR